MALIKTIVTTIKYLSLCSQNRYANQLRYISLIKKFLWDSF